MKRNPFPLIVAVLTILVALVVWGVSNIRDRGRCLNGGLTYHSYFIGSVHVNSEYRYTCHQWERP